MELQIFFLFFFISCWEKVISQAKFPNIDDFTYGYNLLYRNPNEDFSQIQRDADFYLFLFTYNQGKTTPDGNYLVPDVMDLYPVKFCSYSTTTYNEVFGETSYYNYLLESVTSPDTFSGNFEQGAFSNSLDFQRISSENYNNNNLFIYVQSECDVYLIEMQTPPLAPNFIATIKQLMDNTNNDAKAFFYIFDKFGTHYILKTTLGSKLISENKISRPAYQSFAFSIFDTQQAAINSFLNWTPTSLSDQDKFLALEFEEAVEDNVKIILGAELSLDGNEDQWYSSSLVSPVPIHFSLDYIYNLINTNYFPDVDSTTLANFRTNLIDHLEAYCQEISAGRCYGPMTDKLLPEYRIMMGIPKIESIDGPNHITSPPDAFPEYSNYWSNGIGIQRMPGDSDSNFLFYFIFDFRVACSNDIGSICYMVYTPYQTSVYNSVVICPDNTGNPNGICVSCPTGYIATSCGYKPQNINHEANPEIFPVDSNTCKCFHQDGVDCQVICMNDASGRMSNSYEIVTANGINEFTVFCPFYKSPFGCGLQSSTTGDAGLWWVYPNASGCVCYSQNQAKCYAICVDFYDYEQTGDCTGCLVSQCQKNGCSPDGCEDSYFYNSAQLKCVPKPCYEQCRDCSTADKCSFCNSVCSQTLDPSQTTCDNSYMQNNGCWPCQTNYYRVWLGYCAKCDTENDPDKYRIGGNEGNGLCDLCSNLFENCEYCNGDFLPECWKCKANYYKYEISTCTLCDQNTTFINGTNDGTGNCIDKPCVDECFNCLTVAEC